MEIASFKYLKVRLQILTLFRPRIGKSLVHGVRPFYIHVVSLKLKELYHTLGFIANKWLALSFIFYLKYTYKIFILFVPSIIQSPSCNGLWCHHNFWLMPQKSYYSSELKICRQNSLFEAPLFIVK